MILAVGLGNIGKKYEGTPHNAGFVAVEEFYKFIGYDKSYIVSNWEAEKIFSAEIAVARIGFERKIMFVKPTTFMNASGVAVAKIAKLSDVDVKKFLVVFHDDLDLQLGQYKIQRGIGPKKHNGINSIVNSIGTIDFLRVRIGIETRDAELRTKVKGEDYVLMNYSEEQVTLLRETIVDAVKSLRSVLQI